MASQMFTGASHFSISGGNFINQTHLQTSALDKLSAAAAHSALHDAPGRTDESRCHQHSRINLLDHMERWAQGICDNDVSIFWLHGGAGAGKSAIMQTLAERYAAQGLALGSLFFSRSDPTRNTADVLIPTLAYQLAQLFPLALDVLEPMMNREPLTFKKSLQVQLVNLLVHPLQHLLQHGIISDAPQSPRVFLIDGLDECGDATQQQSIIQAVVAVCHEHRIPVKFLIASRPEPAISSSLGWYKEENRVLGSISLSEDPDAEDDIRRFFEDEFLKIRLRHTFKKMIPSEWPNIYDINELVWKSSSHFIYASTAMKYIWSARESPVRSLQVILGLELSRTISPFAELDMLYRHILESAAHCDKVLQVLAHCAFSHLPSSRRVVCIMLDCSLDDLLIYMADVTSLVTLSQVALSPEPDTKPDNVQLLHASFGDFLHDQSRSRSLYIDKASYLASKLERCFQLLNLCSHQQQTCPAWPVDRDNFVWDRPTLLSMEIFRIIDKSGHLDATQEVLSQYNLRYFHECYLRLEHIHQGFEFQVAGSRAKFLAKVHQIAIAASFKLYRSCLEDLFDIVETYISLDNTTLAPAILSLIFAGYPIKYIKGILRFSYSIYGNAAYHFLLREVFYEMGQMRIMDIITPADLASIRHSVYASPQSLAVAAEAIFVYLVDEAKLVCPLPSPTHKLAWVQRPKPQKHATRESPSWRPTKLLIIQGLAFDLLNALLWVIPKACFSEKILLYSERTFPRIIYQYEPNAHLIRRVRKCLDEYTTRVQNEKLTALRHRIEHGDINALITKSRLLNLDAQD